MGEKEIKRYVLIENRNDELFGGEFNSKEEAIKQLLDDFSSLSDTEKKRYSDFYVLKSDNPDEEAENHFDGSHVYVLKVSNENAVLNALDTVVDYDAAVFLMDDEIREGVVVDIAPCTNQEFFDEYCVRHLRKFGEEFELNKKNPNY